MTATDIGMAWTRVNPRLWSDIYREVIAYLGGEGNESKLFFTLRCLRTEIRIAERKRMSK